MALVIAACGGSDEGPDAVPASIEVSSPASTLNAGAELQLSAIVRNQAGEEIPDAAVEWQTTTPGVLFVDATGLVTAIGLGAGVVVATSGEVEDHATLTVLTGLGISSVRIEPRGRSVLAGAALYMTASAVAEDGHAYSGLDFSWATTNSDAATFDGNPGPLVGDAVLVAFGRAGSTTISATIDQVTGQEPYSIETAQWSMVSAGQEGGCGIASGGTGYCWGRNGYGELGTGTGAFESIPTSITGGLQFSNVSMGDATSCGVASGRVYCWGLAGGRAVGPNENSNSPIEVTGLPPIASVTVGWRHACALAIDGTAWCWGYNATGQLGSGSLASTPDPVPVAGGLRFTQLDAGFIHTCGVTVDEVLYCWGSDARGQLGNIGTNEDCTAADPFVLCSRVPAAVNTAERFRTVAAGFRHTCAVTTSGAAMCWGTNGTGELGVGSTGPEQPYPVVVSGGIAFLDISAGGALNSDVSFSCGIATDGRALCWGTSQVGALGAGAITQSLVPQAVSTAERFVTIDTGREHSCAVTGLGVGWCWGFNASYGLGNGRPGLFSSTPARLPG